ncbi:pirin family protein [Paludibacterium yongneupense]|uniref:pirin family protein n=1 Tax=Paludibacterium yongneupense TaxID=400061 RepID=UPI000429B0E2|nr:pirin family protein [Paludibacterium yongneupense]
MNHAPIQRIPARDAPLGDGPGVRRLLPVRSRRMIGAWCFLDHAGPLTFADGKGLRVGPHPHIGLQTFTWVMSGEIRHSDSLGNTQSVRAGQINLMTAGHGISHAEVSPAEGGVIHAAQLWIALPEDLTDMAPGFEHYPQLPSWRLGEATCTLLVGALQGYQAPTRVHSPLLGLDLECERATTTEFPLDPDFEYGLLPLAGEVGVEGETFARDELAYLAPGRTRLALELAPGTKVLLIGGLPFVRDVVMWWNFVGHDKAQIAAARLDWERGDGRFGSLPGEYGPRMPAPALPWRMGS